MKRRKQTSPTEKQLEILEDFGYDTNALSDDECLETVDAIAKNKWQPLPNGPAPVRRKEFGPDSPATAKQKATLRKHEYDDNVTFAEASDILDQLAANDWKPLDGSDDDDELEFPAAA